MDESDGLLGHDEGYLCHPSANAPFSNATTDDYYELHARSRSPSSPVLRKETSNVVEITTEASASSCLSPTKERLTLLLFSILGFILLQQGFQASLVNVNTSSSACQERDVNVVWDPIQRRDERVVLIGHTHAFHGSRCGGSPIQYLSVPSLELNHTNAPIASKHRLTLHMN